MIGIFPAVDMYVIAQAISFHQATSHPCGFTAIIPFLLGPSTAHDMLGLQALGSLELDPETLSLIPV